MGRKADDDPANIMHLSISDKDEFIEGCVSLLKQISIEDLLCGQSDVDDFLQAYVLARALPIIIQNRERINDWRAEEVIDDMLGDLSSKGEKFINTWKPTSMTEAALMLDLINSNGEPCTNTDRVSESVEVYLFESVGHSSLKIGSYKSLVR